MILFSPFLLLPTALLTLISSHTLSTTAFQLSPVPSPEASTDLICHTSDPAECYPALFCPTKDFQTVHADQSIPPGLHVRMNLATGLKEARLNMPEGGEGIPANIVVMDNLPVRRENDQRYVEDENRGLLVQDQTASYNSYGDDYDKASPQRTSASTADEPSVLGLAASILNGSPTVMPQKYLEDLSTLTDLAHDLEWGLVLMQDEAFSKHITQMISLHRSNANTEIRSAAALLLGTALQNNYDALEHFLKHPLQHNEVDPITSIISALEQFANLHKVAYDDILCTKRVVFLLSQLCKDEKQLRKFTAQNGPAILLRIYKDERLTKSDGGSTLPTKIQNFADDHGEALKTYGGLHLLKEIGNTSEAD
ncbi:MAG: hypothetical protein Q9217_001876 [Psora testacea]